MRVQLAVNLNWVKMDTSEILDRLPIKGSSPKVRRRVLISGIAALAVLGPFLGVSFLANSGTTSATVTASGSSGSMVDTTCPTGAYGVYTSVVAKVGTACSSTSLVTPSWSPSAGSAGSVTSGGDIAMVDASGQSAPVELNVYITDLQGLNEDYSSFALPIDVYQCDTSGGACTTVGTTMGTSSSSPSIDWVPITTWDADYSSVPFLTSSSGFFSINLPAGDWYDVAIDGANVPSAVTGSSAGMYYCISTGTSSPATLSPSFFVTASET